MKRCGLRILGALVAAVALTSCLATEGFEGSNGASGGAPMAYNVNLYPLNRLVCDPFPAPDPALYGGLKAELYYWSPAQGARWFSTGDYITKGKKSEKHLFFSELNVPTRLFSMGFPLETGGVVKNDEGQDLIEYFALRFATIVKLGPDDLEGEYELALLSDDGAVLRVRDDNGQYQAVVESDGDHSTRLACGNRRIRMNRDTELMVQLDYYQGPRTEIALVPLWRRVTAESQAETDCGVTGQRTWFDYLNNSLPTQRWHNLVSRGWKPLQKANYEIPQSVASFNPCVPGNRPIISNLKVTGDKGRIFATWETNIPATSQIRVTRISTGAEILTISDNILRTSHSAEHNTANGRYNVQAVSISDTYGKALSEEVEVEVTPDYENF